MMICRGQFAATNQEVTNLKDRATKADQKALEIEEQVQRVQIKDQELESKIDSSNTEIMRLLK